MPALILQAGSMFPGAGLDSIAAGAGYPLTCFQVSPRLIPRIVPGSTP